MTLSNRFPGFVKAPFPCKKPDCGPIRIVKCCPPKPFIKKNLCRARFYDRAVVVRFGDGECPTVTDKCGNTKQVEIMIETFGGPVLIPTNLEQYCAIDKYPDNEIIAIHAEDESEEYCTDLNACPVKLISLSRVWKGEIRNTTGTLSKEIDTNGETYFKLTHVHDQSGGDPYHHLVANKLEIGDINIHYAICNVTGVSDHLQYLEQYLNNLVEIIYVDYGKETAVRCGIPIVVTDLRPIVLEQSQYNDC